MMKKHRTLSLTLAAVMALGLLSIGGCGKKTDTKPKTGDNGVPTAYAEQDYGFQLEQPTAGDTVAIMHTSMGDIFIRLFPEAAPKAVQNFTTHAKNGYYDVLTFHRVINNFMIQGGDPDGTGMGGPGYEIRGEFTHNGFQNDLLHTRGVLSMARTADPNSAGSQFFIMTDDAPHLDNEYASFGMVIEGMDVVDAIVNTKRDWHDRPRETQRMKTVTVDTQGVEYDEPEKV